MKNMPLLFPTFSKYTCIVALLVFTLNVNAQNATATSKMQNVSCSADPAKETIVVSFTSQTEIANMLVLVTDEKGNIIFLDNKYRFKGTYKNVIDLKGEKSKSFEVQIKNDDQVTKKSLSML